MNELFFTYDADTEEHRKGYRARLPGIGAQAVGTQEAYDVHDISVGGLSLVDARQSLVPGDERTLDLLCKGRRLISGLAAQVARRQGDLAGLRFTDLTQRQEQQLDKLVLEVQKYLITQSKNRGCHIDDEHAT